jgi:hypothetical protein
MKMMNLVCVSAIGASVLLTNRLNRVQAQHAAHLAAALDHNERLEEVQRLTRETAADLKKHETTVGLGLLATASVGVMLGGAIMLALGRGGGVGQPW